MKLVDGNEAVPFDNALPTGLDVEVLLRHLPGSFVLLAADDFRVLAASDAFLDSTGLTRARLHGQPLQRLFNSDPFNADNGAAAALLESLRRVRSTRQKDVMALQQHSLRDPRSGRHEEHYWAPVNSPVLDAQGRLLCILHRSEDVTAYVLGQSNQSHGGELPARHRQEAAVVQHSLQLQRLNERLRASEERLRAIFRDTSLGLGVTDLLGNFTEANDAYCRMLGYTLAELRGMNFLDITHPDDRPRNRELRAIIGEGAQNTFVYEKRYITKQGATLWCRMVGSPLRDAQGQVSSLIALAEDITQRKSAEHKLRQQETLARLGGRIARVGGWEVTLGSQSRSVYWSKEIFEILEFEGEDPPNRTQLAQHLFSPAQARLFETAITACQQDGQPFDLELEARSFKGRPLWLRIAGEAETDAEGRVQRSVGALQDITRLKAGQEERQQLNDRLFLTLESMHDAFYLLDVDWTFLYLNSEAERILGVRRNAMVGRNLWAEFPLFAASHMRAAFQRALREQTPFQGEYYSTQWDLWLEVKAFPSREGLAVYFHSISEQKKLQREIVASEQRLKYVTQATLDVAWDWQIASDTLWWSDGLQRHFGHAPDAVARGIEFWRRLLHPEDRDRVWRHFQRGIAGQDSTIANRYRVRRSDGRYAHVEDRCFVIRDSQGKALRLVGGMNDVSEREELEEQLRQSQRLRSLGQLTGGVAHDFNNLLTVILGNSELLMEELGPRSELYELVEMIGGAAQRGADLTRHLLAFSRRQALTPSIVDLNELIQNMEPLLRRTLGEQVDIRLHAAADLSPALVDPHQLESALLNLCINGRDAMPAGGRLNIETRNVELDAHYSAQYAELKPGPYVMLAVTDSGSGIPPEIMERIFEPFFTTKEKGRGTGLGLSSVFGFVKQSNGHVNLYSEVGRGTTVTIYLPRAEGRAGSVATEVSSAPLGGNETVLLVEDDAMVRDYAWQQLNQLGYHVVVAGSGEEALQLLETEPAVDLLFTDLVMAGMGGRELAERALILHPDLKVLYTSGYTELAAIQNGQLDRGTLLLSKPYQRAQLATWLRQVLEDKQ